MSVPWPSTLPTEPSEYDSEQVLHSAGLTLRDDFWSTAVAETLPFVIARNQHWRLLAQEVEQEEHTPGPSLHPRPSQVFTERISALHAKLRPITHPHPSWDRLQLLTQINKDMASVLDIPGLQRPYYSDLYAGSFSHMEKVVDGAAEQSQMYKELMLLDLQALQSLDDT